MTLRVVVGSINPVKIEAAREVLTELIGDVFVEGVFVESGVSKQPLGMDATIKGALCRAQEALKKGDMGIGIEAGLIEVPNTRMGYLDIQFCAITDESLTTLGAGPGFEYPEEVVKAVLDGRTIGQVMEEVSGIRDIGRKMGAVGYLSQGHLTRLKLTKQAVLAAMIPRLGRNE